MTRSSQQAIAAFVLICAFFLAGCATTSQPGARDLIHGYSLRSIEVTISPDAYTGLTERLDDLDEEEFATMVKESLETAMDESNSSFLFGHFAGHCTSARR